MKTLDDQTLDLDREETKSTVLVPQREIILSEPREPQVLKKSGRKISRGLIWSVLGVGAIASTVFGYRWWEYAATHESTNDAYLTGHVHQISSRIAGTVTKVAVNDNQQVRENELLVKLDPRDLKIEVSKAQAALLTAQSQAKAAQANITLASETTQAKSTEAQGNINDAIANIANAQAVVSGAKASIASSQAQVAQANATLNKTKQDYQRYTTLYQQGAVNRQQLDNAQADYQVAQAEKNAADQGVQEAQAQLEQAQQGVNSANAKLAATKSELRQVSANAQQTAANRASYAAAQAKVAQAQAALDDARQQFSYTQITAPTSGKIGSKSVEVGQRVQSGTSLMAVVGNDYWITANFKETQLGKIKPGETVEVKIDAFGDRTFVGKVDSISPASGAEFALLPPDNATGNFTKIVQRIPVKILLDPQSIKGYESRITPGMSAVVSVELAQNVN
jgi:membrane fusion protein, multidrug efflux system